MSTWVPPTPPGGLPALPDNDDFVLGLVNGVPTWKAAPNSAPTLIGEDLQLAINQVLTSNPNISGFYWGLPIPDGEPRTVVVLPPEAIWIIIMVGDRWLGSNVPTHQPVGVDHDTANKIAWVYADAFRALDPVGHIGSDGQPLTTNAGSWLGTTPLGIEDDGQYDFLWSITLLRFNNEATDNEDWVGGSLFLEGEVSAFQRHALGDISIWWL